MNTKFISVLDFFSLTINQQLAACNNLLPTFKKWKTTKSLITFLQENPSIYQDNAVLQFWLFENIVNGNLMNNSTSNLNFQLINVIDSETFSTFKDWVPNNIKTFISNHHSRLDFG
jgi:hypothetical protein